MAKAQPANRMSRARPTRHPVEISDFGSSAIPKIVEFVAVGTRGEVKRARRREAWESIAGLTVGMRQAAHTIRQAHEHCAAGMGMGPLPWQRDRMGGSGGFLWQPERAITSAAHYTRCLGIMGQAGSAVVLAVVVHGDTLTDTDRRFGWRNGRASDVFREALGRVAKGYGVE